jgi:hypothetical protein
MNVRDIPRALWPAFLEQFSRTHRAWLATIDADASSGDRHNDDASSGDRHNDDASSSDRYNDDASSADGHNVDAHPLRSITPFVYNDRVVHIDIRFQDDLRTDEPFRITAPGTLRVDETWEGVARALEIIDSRGISTRLRFRVAPRAEMLDGIAPGEVSH